MIALFKEKSPGNVATLFIFGLLIKLPIFLYPKKALVTPYDGKLYGAFAEWLSSLPTPFFGPILAFVLMYVLALSITNVVNEYRMTTRQTFLPGMSFLLVTSLMPDWNVLSAPLLATTLIFWSFSKLFELYSVSAANSKIYNIGLLLGLATFIFFPSLLLGVCIIIGLMVLRPFRLNEIFLFITGILTPYYFYAIYLFLADQFHWQQLVPPFSIRLPYSPNNIWLAGSAVFIGLPFLLGGYYVQTHLRKMLIQARKNWSIVLMYLLVALAVPFFNSPDTFVNWVVATVPFAIFHASAYLYAPRKWVSLVLFYAALIFILAQQYVTNAWH
ncbi:MAG TPA: hypothetical protein VGE66_19570 [Chitinophagaceae bacterium]